MPSRLRRRTGHAPERWTPVVIVGGVRSAQRRRRNAPAPGLIPGASRCVERRCVAALYPSRIFPRSYLSGAAPAEFMPLRPTTFYEEQRIALKLNARVAGIDAPGRQVQLVDGTRHPYDALLLATAAGLVSRSASISAGANLLRYIVHLLRTMADGDALLARARTAKRAVVIGSSFIGLEVAASLRARDISVDIVAPEAVPMLKILGEEGRDLHPRAP